jgi:DUF4097 and DUF4098 domain-containing protein YvlB
MPEFDRATPVTVSLRLQRGSAQLIAEPRETLQVDITEAGADVSGTFTVRLDGDTLIVYAPDAPAWQWRRSPRAKVVIRVPEHSALAIRSASADIRTWGRFATIHAALESADAEVAEAAGDVQLKAESGDLKVGRVAGALRLSTSSGDLRIGDVTGDVTADTASGDVTIENAAASVTVGTASGDVRLRLVRCGKTRVKTASGDVSVGIAAGTGVWLDLSTSSGSTSNDLSMRGAQGDDLPGATLELRVRTASGDIDVHRVAGPTAAAA